MTTTWTVVYQPSKFSPHLQQTGFVGSWDEAAEYYRTSTAPCLVEAYAAYVTTTDATTVVNEETGRTLKIALTAEQKAAAELRSAQIRTLLAANEKSGLRLLEAWAGRRDVRNLFEAAALAVDNGMDYRAICRVLS